MVRNALHKLDKGLQFFEEWSLFLMVTSALVMLFVSVFTRYAMTYTMTWPEEWVRVALMYATFVGISVAARNRSSIRVDALPNLMPKLKFVTDVFCNFSMLLFASFATWYGVKLAKMQYMTHQKTITLQIPQWILYSVLPLMGVLLILRLGMVLYEDFTGKPLAPKDTKAG